MPGNKNNQPRFYILLESFGLFFEHLINTFGKFLMTLIYRSRYGFTDLLNGFKGDFFVLNLRWLDGFYPGSHFVTPIK